MFDEKKLEQYRSISAPKSLKERVMAQENKSHKIIGFPRKALSLAACIAVVIVCAFSLANTGTSISISTSSAAGSRSIGTGTCITLDVDTRKSAVITVSDGMLKTKNSDELSSQAKINGEAQLDWFVEEDKTYTLTVEIGKKTQQYSLGFNEHSQMWEFEKIN